MYTHCLRCARALQHPVSSRTGYGPVCRAKVRTLAAEYEGHDCYDLPFDGDIVCYREPATTKRGGRLHFNIPPTVVAHGGGWEWGYLGSGPAEFALNILHHYFRPDGTSPTVKTRDGQVVREDVYLLHQDFKRDFLAQMPEDGGKIPGGDVRAWFAANRVTQLSFAA